MSADWLEKLAPGQDVILAYSGGTRDRPRTTYKLTRVISAGAKRVMVECRRDLVFERATGTTVSRHDRKYSLLPPTKENREKLAAYLGELRKREEEREAAIARQKAERERHAIRAAQVLSELSPPRIVEVLSAQTLSDAYDDLVRRGEIGEEGSGG